MSDVHAAVSELLGAWALDACSVEEVATVEAHLAGCPTCAADADRLGRVAAGLGATVATAPPQRLRGAVLAAAVARRPAVARREATDEEVGVEYAGWVDRFDSVLASLTPEQWRERVVHDWSAQDLVAHLTASDELLVAQLAAARPAVPEDAADLDGMLLARRTAAAIDEQRGRPPEHTRAAWRAQADRLVDVATRPAVLDRQVLLADPRLPRQPLRIALVQRMFETWIHTDDVRTSMGAPPAPPDAGQLALIVAFGVRVLPTALRLLGDGEPRGSARLVLSGPAGGDWTLPPSPAGPARPPGVTVTMDAVEFCYLLGNRRDPASVPHSVEGDPELAATLLRAIATVGCDWRRA